MNLILTMVGRRNHHPCFAVVGVAALRQCGMESKVGGTGDQDNSNYNYNCNYNKEAGKHENDEEWQWIDPILFEYDSFPPIVTNIIGKILKSTIVLFFITNFM